MPQDISHPFEVTRYPDPTEAEQKSPLFEAIWSVIKKWDIREDAASDDRSITGAMGNHVAAIMHEIEKAYPASITLKIPESELAQLKKGRLDRALTVIPSEPPPISNDPEDNTWFDVKEPQDTLLLETLEEAGENAEWMLVAWARPEPQLQCYHVVHKKPGDGLMMTQEEFLVSIINWAQEELKS